MIKNRFQSFKGEFFLLIVTLLWGGTFTLIKGALDDISSMLFIAFRFTIALLLLLIFARKKIVKTFDKDFLPPLLLGFFLFVSFATQTVGLKYTLATKSGFITGISVVLIPFVQMVLEKRKPSRSSLIGTAVVFAGLLLLTAKGDSFSFSLFANFNVGDFLTFVCAVSYAVYVVYLDLLSKRYSFYFLLFFQFVTMTILGYFAALIFSFSGIETVKVIFTSNLFSSLLYVSVFATLITTALQTKYQKLVTPTKAGIIFAFEPVFAAIIAYFALNEKIGNFGYVGSLLIFFGLIISETSEGFLNGKR